MPVTELRNAGPVTVDKSQEVKQDNVLVKFYSAAQSAGTLLYSAGLNPCLGIAFHGEVEFNGEEQVGKTYFVAMNHNSGLPQNLITDIINQKVSVKEAVTDFCNQAIVNLILAIEDQSKIEINTIILKRSYLVRCEQIDKKNLQEKVAAKIEEILSDENKILLAVDDDDSLIAECSIAANYMFLKMAEKEQAIDHETDSIHFILQANEFASPLTLHHKGFSSLTDVLQGNPSPVNFAQLTMMQLLQARLSPQSSTTIPKSPAQIKLSRKRLHEEFLHLPIEAKPLNAANAPLVIASSHTLFSIKSAAVKETETSIQHNDKVLRQSI
jgi:hypothetical protein